MKTLSTIRPASIEEKKGISINFRSDASPYVPVIFVVCFHRMFNFINEILKIDILTFKGK